MEKTGITRRIDDLGRIVIPKEIRRYLKIKDSDELEISIQDNQIILSKFESLKKDQVLSCLLYSVGRFLNKNVVFTSRDKIVDYYLVDKDEMQECLDEELMNIIEKRQVVTNETVKIKMFRDNCFLINPLIIRGDLIGSLIFYGKEEINKLNQLIMAFCKCFLENYLE